MNKEQIILLAYPLVSEYLTSAVKNSIYPVLESNLIIQDKYFPNGYNEHSIRKIVNWLIPTPSIDNMNVYLQIQNNTLDDFPELKNKVQKEIDGIRKTIPNKINEIINSINVQ